MDRGDVTREDGVERGVVLVEQCACPGRAIRHGNGMRQKRRVVRESGQATQAGNYFGSNSVGCKEWGRGMIIVVAGVVGEKRSNAQRSPGLVLSRGKA